MKTTGLFESFSRLKPLSYLLLSSVHWKPREEAILALLITFCHNLRYEKLRIVDVGCGPGMLMTTVTYHGFQYLGIDTQASSIRYCVNKYPPKKTVHFVQEDISESDFRFEDNDIAVLNGVAHHLTDAKVASILAKCKHCCALIICDHLMEAGPAFAGCRLSPMLQRWDRGRFVRPLSYFQKLKGFRLLQSRYFNIGFMKVPLWDYFCNFYKPETSTM